jgi:hypothetical protein
VNLISGGRVRRVVLDTCSDRDLVVDLWMPVSDGRMRIVVVSGASLLEGSGLFVREDIS